MPDSLANRPPAHLLVEDLTAGYSDVPVISGISVAVARGEIASIIGPNGAGKSTLLKAIVGVIPAMSGRVTLDGQTITNLPTEQLAKRGIGYVPQMKDVFGTMTVVENLMMGGYLFTKPQVLERMGEVYAIFPDLEPMRTRLASRLSGGERKMLALGRALMLRPSVMILDEPTANLSPQLSTAVLEGHVRRLAATGVAVLLVEQKARQAMQIADWTYVLNAGRTQLAGPPTDLLARPDFGELMLGQALGPQA